MIILLPILQIRRHRVQCDKRTLLKYLPCLYLYNETGFQTVLIRWFLKVERLLGQVFGSVYPGYSMFKSFSLGPGRA